ncbi:MAG TPA: alkaline phosphatase family protein [Streptosporangiaceae bacterium]|nr:alkaline phosphatase family protein [Streptosporangiaceae bacterium]
MPNYGSGSLSDLACSVLAALGVNGTPNPLALPPSARVCLLIVDGLGWELLRQHPAAAPFLSELVFTGRALTAGFPATTVTNLTSLATGLPPGEHGMLGYQVAVPGAGRLLNGLRWDERVDPLSWQPSPSIYQQAEAAGVAAYRVAARALQKTGFSAAAMRGASYRSADSMGALVGQTAAALAAADRCLVTVYHAELDGTGHAFGSQSDAWFYQLAHVDKLAEQLAGALPSSTTMYITADHGMVDSAPEEKIDVDELPVLRDGVALLGGEPRARHVYAVPGAAADVLIGWQQTLGSRAWVVTRDEAIEAGWFGHVAPRFAARIGDVVAAPAGSWAIVASKAERLESSLIGMHGSLTPGDQYVPMLSVSSR